MIVASEDGRELAGLLAGLPPGRNLLGISGSPGAGKSTLAVWLAAHAGAVVVPMDGFHLPDAELERRGLREVKGAPETFDSTAYADLLTRISAGEIVTAPAFEHAVGEPVAGAIRVPAYAPLVVTEGNYLLLPDEPWPRVRAQLDQVWHVVVDDELRRERLLARAMRSGKAADVAREWVERVDTANTRLVEAAVAYPVPDHIVGPHRVAHATTLTHPAHAQAA